MRNLKRARIRVYAGILALAVLAGCASVAPGNDPIVVRAEQVWQIGFETVDAFLYVESQGNVPFLKTEDVKKFVAKLTAANPDGELMGSGRVKPYGKWVFDRLDKAILAYKSNRTPEGKAAIETFLETARSLLETAQSLLRGQSALELRREAEAIALRRAA